MRGRERGEPQEGREAELNAVMQDVVAWSPRDALPEDVRVAWARDNPEMREAFAAIDTEFLKGLFQRIAMKSGATVPEVNFVPPERVVLLSEQDKELHGGYNLKHNAIVLSEKHVARIAREADVPFSLALLRVYAHELAHAAAYRSFDEKEHRLRGVDKKVERTGYATVVVQRRRSDSLAYQKKAESSFELFNEGVMEVLTEEVLTAYLQETEREKTAPEEIKEQVAQLMQAGFPYEGPRRFVELLAERLGERTGRDYDAVWQEFLRGFFERGTFTDEQKQAFAEHLGAHFFEDLAEVRGRGKLQRLLRLLESPAEKKGELLRRVEKDPNVQRDREKRGRFR